MSLSEPGEMGDSQSDSQSTESVFRPIRRRRALREQLSRRWHFAAGTVVGCMLPSRETLHNGDVFYILEILFFTELDSCYLCEPALGTANVR
jgi:hypothetical protein